MADKYIRCASDKAFLQMTTKDDIVIVSVTDNNGLDISWNSIEINAEHIKGIVDFLTVWAQRKDSGK